MIATPSPPTNKRSTTSARLFSRAKTAHLVQSSLSPYLIARISTPCTPSPCCCVGIICNPRARETRRRDAHTLLRSNIHPARAIDFCNGLRTHALELHSRRYVLYTLCVEAVQDFAPLLPTSFPTLSDLAAFWSLELIPLARFSRINRSSQFIHAYTHQYYVLMNYDYTAAYANACEQFLATKRF